MKISKCGFCCGRAYPLLVMLIILHVTACAHGDGATRIKGSVADERNVAHESCNLELLSADKKHVIDYRPIPSEFLVTFVISPRPEVYSLRVACKTSDEVFTSGLLLLGDLKTTYEVPADIGVIRLKRRR